jgi:hypothetical protein
MHRHGQLELILVLPDGSKSLIPAEWTDLAPSSAVPHSHDVKTLAPIRALLHARAIVEALQLKRQDSLAHEARAAESSPAHTLNNHERGCA